MRQSNLQLQMSRRIRAVRLDWLAHTQCGWTGWRTLRFARLNLAKLHNRVANLSSPKKNRPCPNKPNSSFEAYVNKTCTTTHKIDIKTRQKHRYNTSPIFRSIFFPRNYNVVHLSFINKIDHF